MLVAPSANPGLTKGLTGMLERLAELNGSLEMKNYVSTILDKLNTRDRTRAALKAITLQII